LKRRDAEPIKQLKDLSITLAVLELGDEIGRNEATQQKVGQLARQDADKEGHNENNDFI
jgi:hypothetical protein